MGQGGGAPTHNLRALGIVARGRGACIWRVHHRLGRYSLNWTLDGVSPVPAMRKPFDVLAEGLVLADGRGDWPNFEPFEAIGRYLKTFFRPPEPYILRIGAMLQPSA